MKKILMCTGEETTFDKNQIMFRFNKKNLNISFVKMFSSEKKIHRIIRNLGSLFISFELTRDWKNDLSEYDAIILFDSVVKNSAVKYIRKRNPNVRIIIYFRNQFTDVKKRNISLDVLKKYDCEFWSYNLNDCKNLGFKYNSQFWNTNYFSTISKSKKNKFDCLFLGKIKSRENEILSFYNLCQKLNLKEYFYLVPKTTNKFDRNVDDKYLDYVEYLNLLNNSKSIIDLVNKDNYGLTIRPLEAMFLEKKLITNYAEIKEYDFYNKNNIFILEEDNLEELDKFLDKPFKSIDNSIKESYDFEKWIYHFFD